VSDHKFYEHWRPPFLVAAFELMDWFIQSIFCACTKTSLAEHTV